MRGCRHPTGCAGVQVGRAPLGSTGLPAAHSCSRRLQNSGARTTKARGIGDSFLTTTTLGQSRNVHVLFSSPFCWSDSGTSYPFVSNPEKTRRSTRMPCCGAPVGRLLRMTSPLQPSCSHYVQKEWRCAVARNPGSTRALDALKVFRAIGQFHVHLDFHDCRTPFPDGPSGSSKNP